MAEAILKRVPGAEESLEPSAGTREADKVSQCLPTDYLVKKLQDAEQLLCYAAEAGVEVETKVRDAVLKATVASAGNWSQEIAANLLSALTTLAAKLKPITSDSLKECADGPVKKFIRMYEWVAIALASIIIPCSVATFVTSSLSEAIRKDIETANGLAVKLGDELRATRAPNATGQEWRTQIVTRDLQEFAAIIRAIHARGWQLNVFVGSIIADPFNTTREKLELTIGIPDFSKEVTDKLGVYQDVRYFAQSIREIVSIIYGALGTCILPVLYALLGACAYLLRSLEEQIKLRTFIRSNVRIARFVIAAIGGAVVGLFNNFTISQSASIPPLAIAFLVGYAADVFFSFLEGLLQTFTRRPGSQTQSAAKS